MTTSTEQPEARGTRTTPRNATTTHTTEHCRSNESTRRTDGQLTELKHKFQQRKNGQNFAAHGTVSNELQPRNFDVVALQEVCLEEEQVLDWPGRQTNSRFYLSGGKDKKLGTGFIVRGKMQDRVFGFTAISERMCKLRIRGRFFNYSIINVHCPHEEKTDDEKEAFYATLEEVYDGCPRQDVKIIIGDMNARFGREEMFRPTIGPESLHAVTNDNGQRCIDFAASRGMVVRSTYFPRKDIHKATWTSPDQRTKTQIDHLSTVYNQRRSRRAPPFNTACLQNGEVAHSYAQQLEANLPGEEELGAASLEDGWSRIRSAIGSAAEATLGFVPRADVCRDSGGNLIVNKSEVLDRWKQYFNEHLNGDEANGDGDGVNLGAPAADEHGNTLFREEGAQRGKLLPQSRFCAGAHQPSPVKGGLGGLAYFSGGRKKL
ncbi:uncharacterized protein LOC128092669 [Culex pipiens pallens]|uniref:uncharacterized protein LOC128092669 n=1 Tax=Culex pipiens pallens TaxID=42434 RepID=UPI0022AA7A1F|nr:uncharacterized protein LOC128092669 [Culex pipiens pallens]